MPSTRVSKDLNSGTYFLTLTVNNFYYLFDRYNRWEILSDSIKYFQEYKELKIHAFVLMLNHIHLIIETNHVSEFLRDFKKFTSKEIKKNILLYEPKILPIFKRNNTYRFWSKTNMPKFIESEVYYQNKISYIENNPVEKGYVSLPEHWYWSSANVDCELKVNNE